MQSTQSTINAIRITNNNRWLRLEYGYIVVVSKNESDYYRFIKCGEMGIEDPIPKNFWVIANCSEYRAITSEGYATSRLAGNPAQIEMYNLSRDEIRTYTLLGRNFEISAIERRGGFFDKPNRVKNDMAWFQATQRGWSAFRFTEGQSNSEWAWQITSQKPELAEFFSAVGLDRDNWMFYDRKASLSPFFGGEPEFEFAPEVAQLVEQIEAKAPACSTRKKRLLKAFESKNEKEFLSVLAECKDWIGENTEWWTLGMPDAYEAALGAL
jgi:hypothetical protein